ncbi:serine/threonine-protein phosphatase 7 long form homolog [Quercus suber]|uniref:serine/threonine-protein phosphatase 7 long form homolog n=1 Tax=Quercus suber TaxID=58331 RepID=UPI0032DFE53F
MDKSADRVSVRPLLFLNPISNAKRYSWGSGALAWLYRHLCKASETTAMQIGGALMLVQLWAYSRFPLICPVTRPPQPPMDAGPLACRWKGPKSTTEHATHVLAAYRASLSSMRAHQVVWEPYRDVLDSLPPYCTAGRHIWRATVPLIYFWIVEDHHPERVFRQFGMKQAPPGLVDTSVELHRISLQGKLETDWVQQHAIYIDRWAHRGERVANAPTLDGDTTYLAAYMAEYRRSTRRYITRESAYWEILVESNVEMLLQCQPGSAMYNQLTKTLDLVGELNRVALDNVRAMASEASTQATTVVGEVVGLEGVDVVEAVEVVEVVLIFTSMTWMMRRWRPIGTRTWMAPGHRDARLTPLPRHPILLAMTIVQNTHPMLRLALDPHYPLRCLPHCSAALLMRVAVYLYPPLVYRPHL